MKMKPLSFDLSIWKELELDSAPIGVKFLFDERPEEDIRQLEELNKYTLCEMIKVAQHSPEAFYIRSENESCAGKMILGMEELPPPAAAGVLGYKMGIFNDPRANARLDIDLPRFAAGTVNSVVFAPLEKIAFDPDMLFVLAEPTKAEIVLRAMTWSTGERYETHAQHICACAWLFAYPMQSGKVNFITTGLSYGMKTFEVFPPGLILLCIPYQWIKTITENLAEIDFVLKPYTMGREVYQQYFAKLTSEL
jgi:uncharacterized protein (DUF169 family)